jgi:hypothetical protein
LGGEKKLSSNLAEDARIDVRAKIAEVAGVCPANVTKIKRLIESADVAVLTAFAGGRDPHSPRVYLVGEFEGRRLARLQEFSESSRYAPSNQNTHRKAGCTPLYNPKGTRAAS